MTPTRIWVLVVLGAVAALGAWLILRVTYASLPPLPWTGVPALLILAIGESWLARDLQARIMGRRRDKPIAPIAVSRVAAFAKASSHAAAIIAGLAGGFFIYVAASLDKAAPRSDAVAAGVTFLAALVLVAAALYLEHACRVPSDDEDEKDVGSRR